MNKIPIQVNFEKHEESGYNFVDLDLLTISY